MLTLACDWLTLHFHPVSFQDLLLHLTGSGEGCLIFHWEKRRRGYSRGAETITSVSKWQFLRGSAANVCLIQTLSSFFDRVPFDGVFLLSLDGGRRREHPDVCG